MARLYTIVTQEDKNMKNWFKRKSTKDKLNETLLKWYDEKEEKRAALMVILDDEEGMTTCGVYGTGNKIIEALINECMHEENIASLLMEAMNQYLEIKYPPIDTNLQPIEEEKPKKKRKKTDKVVS